MPSLSRSAIAVISLIFTPALFAQSSAPLSPMAPNIPEHFTPPHTDYDYTIREVMIPMRDGVKLYTVIAIPKGAHNAPIVLTRTPYNAAKRMQSEESPHMIDALPMGDDEFVQAGYIRVYQDVRGKYGSEGVYVMTPPPTGPLNPNGPNDTTDAWDTIDWLVKNVPESNGKVGMIGSSYEGFTVVMALLDPHPALKVAAPESPMIDGWMGDDWFHYGAFRQDGSLDYIAEQTEVRGDGKMIPRLNYDDYTNYLEAGSAGAFARYGGIENLAFYRQLHDHPAYDAYWQDQALDKLIAKVPLKVPVLWEQGLWDQEDMWGANHCYEAAGAQRQKQRHELPGDGSVVPQPDQSQGLESGAIAVDRRHHAAVPEGSAGLLQSISERRRAQGRHTSGVGVQHRRESLGPLRQVALELRPRMPGHIEAALSRRRWQAFL